MAGGMRLKFWMAGFSQSIPVLFQNLQKKGDEMHHLELKK